MELNNDLEIDFYDDVIFEDNRLISPPSAIVELANEIFKSVKYSLNYCRNHEHKYEDYLSFKLHNLLIATKCNRNLVYSRDQNYYKKKYSCDENKHFWERAIVKDASDVLERLWYIKQVKGQRAMHDMLGFRTRAISRRRLVERLDKISIGNVIRSDNIETIVLRDRKKVLKKGNQKIIKRIEMYYNDEDYCRIPKMREELSLIYNYYKEQDLVGFLPIDIAEKNQRLVNEFLNIYNRTGKIELFENPTGYHFSINERTVRRIFNEGTFFNGGRLYAFWQQIPKALRKFLLINGSPVAELDFSGCQIRMLYHMMLKKDYKGGCPYTINGYSRDLIKKAAVITINASTPGSAAKALRGSAKKDLGKTINLKTAERYIDAFSNAHWPISSYFNSGAGLFLMRIESEVIVRIILELIKKGICVLTIHDSCIFPIQYKNEVYEAMISEYKRILGFYPVVKLE